MADATSARTIPEFLSLAGRRIAVTGAASGIGRETARAAARLGAELVLCDRAPLAAVAGELGGGNRVATLEADMADDGWLERFMALGPYDGIAHCAAVFQATPWQDDASPRARFARTMDVNVRVPLELGQALVDHMAGRGGGAVVLLGSAAGRTGGTSRDTPIDYAASKGALHVVVRWLSRHAVGRGVRVNGIAPGPVATPMTAEMNFDPALLPSGRMGRPEEIAWMAAVLLTPAASYMSGAVVDVNGGTYVG